ncbi:MAG: hypothetical protein MUO50_04375 [Longimicrobiales bacterium]|nr:hypothetical protein [Longimicrobiales bacterium]
MSLKRLSILTAVGLILMLPSSCGRDDDGVGLLEPQFAKGGKPGAPAEETFELREFYIFRDASGQSVVHVVGKGKVDRLNLSAVQDYAFNGMADDDHTPHYEYSTGPPLPVAVSQNDEGIFHVDVPWAGEREVDPETRVVTEYFKDFPTSDVDGRGGDPFAFWMWYLRDGETGALKLFEPQGIVLNGKETFSAKMSAGEVAGGWHSLADLGGTVYS